MHNYCKTIGALAAVSALAAGNAMANVEYELATGYTNAYIFRGMNLGQDLVEVSATAKGQWNNVSLAGGAWYGSFDNTANLTEIDVWADAGYDFGFATMSVGYIYRYVSVGDNNIGNLGLGPYADGASFPDGAGNQEVYFSIARDFGGWNTSLTYYLAVEDNNDGYMELATKKEWVIPGYDCMSIGFTSRLGYLAEQGDCTHWSNRLAFNWAFAERAKLSPFVQYDISLSEGGAAPTTVPSSALDNFIGMKNQITGGCMLSVSF